MDKSNKLNGCDYGYLCRLPIDKLLELLALAPSLSDKPEDEAYMDALEEAIIEKENENPTGFFPDVDQQWEQFVTYYLPDQKDTALEPERTEHAVSAQINRQSPTIPPKRVVRFKRVWRTVLVAAIAIACMFAAMVTAQAAGVDVFGAMARWTQDVFSFGVIPPNSEITENLGGEMESQDATGSNQEGRFSSLQEALDKYGVTMIHEPNWLPEGYALGELEVMCLDDPFLQTFAASYSSGDGHIDIDIMSYLGTPSMQVEKTDVPVETVEKNGINLHLIENVSSYIVAWYDNQYEYYISGNLSKDILCKTAISMYD